MTEEVMEQVRFKVVVGIDKIIRHWNLTSTSTDWQPLYGGATVVQDIYNFILSIPEILIKDPDQSFPDMIFYCPNCEKMVKNTRCNVIGNDCFKVLLKELNV